MKRREFSEYLASRALGLATLAGGTGPALAQGTLVQGKDFVPLAPRQPTSVPRGKVEVLDFFSYTAPACLTFETLVDTWRRKLPANVVFRRVPVAFRPADTTTTLFYTLEALGKSDALHRKIFDAVHLQGRSLTSGSELSRFMTENGVDSAEFNNAFNSLAVKTKVRQATQLAISHQIDRVPTLSVGGRYKTSSFGAGSNERALQVADQMIQSVIQSEH